MTNKRVIFASRPVGALTEASFRVEEAPIPKPAEGEGGEDEGAARGEREAGDLER